jgi:hypothetical protein
MFEGYGIKAQTLLENSHSFWRRGHPSSPFQNREGTSSDKIATVDTNEKRSVAKKIKSEETAPSIFMMALLCSNSSRKLGNRKFSILNGGKLRTND